MKQNFGKFREWLAANYEDGLNDLNPPATDKEIEELSDALGYALPEDLVCLLQIHNGQKGDAGWLFDGQEFLSSDRIIDEWKIWKDLLDSGDFDETTSEPQKGIKEYWWSEKWIPFTYNGSGDHYCIDLDPADSGASGQVITMWHDDEERALLAPSLSGWFASYFEKILAGEYIFSEEYDSIINKNEI